jgi:hypothetical protein
MSSWDFTDPVFTGEGLVKFDLLMPQVEFRPAGSVSGIPLVEHTCERPGREGSLWISAEPSADDDPYVVPFCGCRPRYRTRTGKLLTEADIEKLAEEAERGYELGSDEPARG